MKVLKTNGVITGIWRDEENVRIKVNIFDEEDTMVESHTTTWNYDLYKEEIEKLTLGPAFLAYIFPTNKEDGCKIEGVEVQFQIVAAPADIVRYTPSPEKG